MKFYQDIHVKRGKTLTVKCELQMVPEARIVVEPGGRLVIDGGKITSATFGAPWRGIEVWGTSAEHQNADPVDPVYLEYQGLIEIINGGVVENALVGVHLGHTGDPDGSGGVLRMEGTANPPYNIIHNCQVGVRFAPYVHLDYLLSPPSPPYPISINNQSKFRFAHFVHDDGYVALFEENFIAHVDLDAVHGLNFLGCDFRNDRQTPATSLELGYGIRSYNARFMVNPSCPTSPFTCSAASQLPSRFIGLDHGIHATGGASGTYASVQYAEFENNVCGVYANGITSPKIGKSDFVLGARDVTLTNLDEEFWLGYHRGIFLTECAHIQVMDNDLVQSGTQPTEGIVVGYTRDNNAMVFRNVASGLDYGYIGEGISASIANPGWVGLQFICNENSMNTVNFKSRVANGAPEDDEPFSTIRQVQGGLIGTVAGIVVYTADNLLDQCLNGPGSGELDFEVETGSPITYLCRTTSDYFPECSTGPFTPVNNNLWSPYPGCVLIPFAPGDPQQYLIDLETWAQSEKLAYGNVRYLYDDLIDGGNTDEVVLEIMSSWPQDAWDLRAYLLGLSPFLSVEVLKEAMDKPGFPQAMKAEVCIANPETTQKEGFIKWLEEDCLYPMPETLIASIVASWDNKTYRFTLEAQMAQHHANLSQAVVELLNELQGMEGAADLEKVQDALQLVRSPGARYNEAFLLLQQQRYAEATALVEGINTEHMLKDPEQIEHEHILELISYLADLHNDGRTEADLTSAEVATLKAGIDGVYDRATNAISNLLCHHYGECRPPITGGHDASKSLTQEVRSVPGTAPVVELALYPNPATNWTTCAYALSGALEDAMILVKDGTGRPVLRIAVTSAQGQSLLDTRNLAKGLYTVELLNGGAVLKMDKLILQ